MAYVVVVKLKLENQEFDLQIFNRLQIKSQNKINSIHNNIRKKQVYFSELLKYYMISIYRNMNAFGIEYMKNEYGKPFIDSKYKCKFNISHSGQYVVGIVDEYDVGIDIENIRELIIDAAPLFLFHTNEIEFLKTIDVQGHFSRHLFHIWTLKEAYLKALGVGLTKALSTFEVINNNSGIYIIDHEQLNNTTIYNFYNTNFLNNNYIMSTVSNTRCTYTYLTEKSLIELIYKVCLSE